MAKAQISPDSDLVACVIISGPSPGIEIDDALTSIPPTRLRWDGKKVVDINSLSTREFYVDKNGVKRLTPADGRQAVTCAGMDELRLVSGKWSVVSPLDIALAKIRAERNRLLSASDWTQLGDVPAATKKSWATYRKALRELPETITDPSAPVQWPQPPA